MAFGGDWAHQTELVSGNPFSGDSKDEKAHSSNCHRHPEPVRNVAEDSCGSELSMFRILTDISLQITLYWGAIVKLRQILRLPVLGRTLS